MELRIRDERAVLAGPGGASAREVDPHQLALGAGLADALHEWARVAAAVGRSHADGTGQTGADVGTEAAVMISQRGRQLATRVAAIMGTSVRYLDPVTGGETVVTPPARRRGPGVVEQLLGRPDPAGEPTPWATGLTVSAFVAAVVIVAMLALAGTLASEASGWLALFASAVVTAGIAPSMWLARNQPILRWVALGASAGVVVAWVGVLVLSF